MSVRTGVVQVQPEVVAGAERRRFTAEYKRRILREAAACPKPGELGARIERAEALLELHAKVSELLGNEDR